MTTYLHRFIDDESTQSFEVKTGVKQGCFTVLIFFSISISAVLHLVLEKLPRSIDMQFRIDAGSLFNLRRLKAKKYTTHMTILELQYCNDNALVTQREEDLQAVVNAFSYAYDALGLKRNARKTRVLFQLSPDHTRERKQPEITAVGDQCLSSIDHFTYCLSSKADLDVETQVRLQSASAAFGRLRDRVFDNKNIYINTKIKAHKAILPTLRVWLRS